MRIERLTARERNGNGTDGEIALAEVRFDRLAAQGGDVDLPALVGRYRSPGVELGRELKGVPAALAGDRLGQRGRVAADGEIEVDDLAPERRVANRPADDPGPLPLARRPARQADQAGGTEPLRDRAHTVSRGTRAEIPQLTS